VSNYYTKLFSALSPKDRAWAAERCRMGLHPSHLRPWHLRLMGRTQLHQLAKRARMPDLPDGGEERQRGHRR
jgi:hypothetical protein